MSEKTDQPERATNRRETEEARRAADAQGTLERITSESETIGSSQLARMGTRARDHVMGADAPPGDSIEVWGRRIGRVLAIAFVIFLVLHLYKTYVAV